MHTTANSTVTATVTTTTTPIATAFRAKTVEMKISNIYGNTGYQKDISAILKGEEHLTKRQYLHTTANSTVTATVTTTTTSIATAFRAKSVEMKISNIYGNTGYQKDISAMS